MNEASRACGVSLRVEGRCEVDLSAAFAAAVRNLAVLNTVPYDRNVYNQTGLLPEGGKFIRAGHAYEQPWTRDAAINCWNAASVLTPEVARNTLWSVCQRNEAGRLIVQRDLQWWDKVIWVRGAWEHFSATGDEAFLTLAAEASAETLNEMEAQRLNRQYGLFEGPAVMGDGIAGYPSPPASADRVSDFVLEYPLSHHLMCLSTNCIYANAYQCWAAMAERLGRSAEASAARAKGVAVSEAVNRHLWLADAGTYGYFVHGAGPMAGQVDRHQEALGLAFAVLTGVADAARTASLMAKVHIEPMGIPAVWPHFAGYDDAKPGRHNVMCWPMICGFWAQAAMRAGRSDLFYHELVSLARSAMSHDGEFFELYDAKSGAIDGGWQPTGPSSVHYESYHHQTWSATAFLRMVMHVLVGMKWEAGRVRYEPMLPAEITRAELVGFWA